MKKTKIILLLACIFAVSFWVYGRSYKPSAVNTSVKIVPVINRCSNEIAKIIVVSIGKRRLWACQDGKQQYVTPVITGYTQSEANLTPLGSYKIYAKQTDRFLKGSDDKGSWNEHVNYWMPFLYNQYGAYGFHDADWRPDSSFGSVSPDTRDASHGCVELPDSASKWLYAWSEVGTIVKIVK